MAKMFAAQVDAFRKLTAAKLELVFKQSAQDVFETAQTPVAQGGRMRVDTGFLRNSFMSALNGQSGLAGPNAYVAVIAGLELGDTVFGGWTANYARHVEYGTSRMAGSFFALNAAQQWQAIVAANAAKVAAI